MHPDRSHRDRPAVDPPLSNRPARAANLADHINALAQLPRHWVHRFNPVDRPDAAALLDLDEFDVVVIHHSIAVTIDGYLPEVLRDKIARFRGLKASSQDVYRTVDAVTARTRELGIDVRYTLAPEREVPRLYGRRIPGVQTITTLAGFVPDELMGRPTRPLAERPIEVGYRGGPSRTGSAASRTRSTPLGIVSRARGTLRAHVRLAVGEGDRIYGERWNRFLASCRATLGTRAELDSRLRRVDRGSRKERSRRHSNAAFEEVEHETLAPYERNVVINVISPRQFEAAALRTAMILHPGEHSGVVEPWTHYIPLAKNFSNMDEVVERLRDLEFLSELTERTHDDPPMRAPAGAAWCQRSGSCGCASSQGGPGFHSPGLSTGCVT
jgi:hypothetical protein